MELNITTNVDAQPGKVPSKEKKGSVASRYEQLKTNRNPYEDRAIDSVKVTIPSLFTNEVHGDQGRLKTPYQSTGARGLLHLANKLGLSLFPPNTPFFKFRFEGTDQVIYLYAQRFTFNGSFNGLFFCPFHDIFDCRSRNKIAPIHLFRSTASHCKN